MAILESGRIAAIVSSDVSSEAVSNSDTLFENPFQIEDLMVFDDETLRRILDCGGFGMTLEDLAASIQNASKPLVTLITQEVPPQQQERFLQLLHRPLASDEVERARRQVLDGLFWELTYWKTPGFYEELTEGERLHPGIFQQLEPDIRGKTVLDAGAGSGRASFECVRYGAKQVYAVEPSPGLLRILRQKLTYQPEPQRIIPQAGRFDALPYADKSVDITLSCSAFTALPEQGGEQGLEELRRVTRPGGKIVLIWPRAEDADWLAAHGFRHVTLPVQEEMRVHFRSLHTALQCAKHFYAQNKAVAHYILKEQKPEVPFSVIGVNPPCGYSWLSV